MKICTEFNPKNFSNFSDSIRALCSLMAYDDVRLASDEDDLSPCYLDQIYGTQHVPSAFIPAVLEAGCYFHQSQDDGLLCLSVTSSEANHQDWLAAVQDYPGVTIVKHIRNSGKSVYWIMLPVIPKL